MKYLILPVFVFVISFLALCNKEEKYEPEIFVDTFGMIEFNTSKRVSVETRRKPRPPQSQNIGDSGVILLDFDGYFMSGTMFNTDGDKTMAASGLSLEEQQIVLDTVANRFSQFKIIVTDDENIFNKASVTKRIRIVITESWEWFGMVGGVAYLNSFTWADETPAFVFSSLLNYNLKWISSASSHESGHTLGLRHQAKYDENCVKIQDYSTGEGDWSPIMGVSYYKEIELWIYGQDSRGCNYWQNDSLIIKSKVP